MTTCPTQLEYRRLCAPRENRSALIDPPLDEAGTLADENAGLQAQHGGYDCQGRLLRDLSRQARAELLREARSYTAAYRDAGFTPEDPPPKIFLAGHQPQVFHPGVWLKNFALGHAASRHGAVGVNLLIDSDTCRGTGLRVPTGTASQPQAELLLYDCPDPKIPYEQRRIEDRETFARFGSRVMESIAPLVTDPLIADYWPLVLERAKETDNLGACLAQARHQMEGEWGSTTLEIPQSYVCRTESFCWFAAHLIARASALRRVYNEAVREYRRVYRIRSKAHPVPDLAADGEWLEVPLWIYSAGDPRRRKLFVRPQGRHIRLSDRDKLEIDLPLAPDGDARRAVQRLMELGRQGVKIRSRALITTLWARLALGDLFLHGIGGAKYDQVADLLIRRLFGLTPPRFMVLSATLHLPIERPGVAIEEARAIDRHLRRLVYHPEEYIDGENAALAGEGGDPAELIAEKRHWIRTPQTPHNARTRCRAIRRINRALQPWIEQRREQLRQRQAQTARALRAEEVLTWREYGYCLFPEKTLREFLSTLLSKRV